MIRNDLILTFLALILLTNGCSRESAESDNFIARVGEREISAMSFKRAYLPVIMYGDKFDSPETREETLNYLIGQKMLAQESERAGFDTLSQVHQARRAAERRALSRQLYQTWVAEQLPPPSEMELRRAFEKSRKDVLVRHLFTDSEEKAQALHDVLVSGSENFHTLAQDVFDDSTLTANGGMLGWMAFGDLDETLEDTAYSLPVGVPSSPVQSRYGWHILQVDDYQQDLFHTEEDYRRDLPIITRKLMERRENVFGQRVLNDFMREQQLEFNRETARELWPLILDVLYPDDPQLQENTQVQGPEFGRMLRNVAELKNEALITFNGETWTVEQVVTRLPELERRYLYGNLYAATANLVRDELLSREARKLGLDEHPDVLEEIRDSQDLLLAEIYTAAVADTLIYTPEHINRHYEKNKITKYHAPDSLLVREILFSDSSRAVAIMIRLRQGEDFSTLARAHSERDLSKDTAGLLGWLNGPEPFPEIYDHARKITSGVPTGPVHSPEGWSVIQVEDRRRWPLPFAEVEAKITTEMQNLKFSATKDILLDELRQKYEIHKNVEQLDQLWAEG